VFVTGAASGIGRASALAFAAAGARVAAADIDADGLAGLRGVRPIGGAQQRRNAGPYQPLWEYTETHPHPGHHPCAP
jgi:NAD(P)-dependent dehydrogenase (short-subunit alcohol dehydrogenase family)